ncbi:MAG: DsrE family protein [Chitinophagaceae bacterium]|nr:DsrE family protein [Chitinophagaceae bacterium]
MKQIFTICVLLVSATLNAQNKVNPVIKNFGTVSEIPYAVEKPDPKLDYKIVVEINSDNPKPETVHEFFEKTAAVVNLHALGGVPKEKLHVVMVVHGPAAQFIVNNEAYRKKFGVDNPNLPLFTALQQAGVQLFICGQSVVKRNIDPATIAPEVKVSLSAITALTTYQLKGYALLKY